jgi:hypothetical protein
MAVKANSTPDSPPEAWLNAERASSSSCAGSRDPSALPDGSLQRSLRTFLFRPQRREHLPLYRQGIVRTSHRSEMRCDGMWVRSWR